MWFIRCLEQDFLFLCSSWCLVVTGMTDGFSVSLYAHVCIYTLSTAGNKTVLFSGSAVWETITALQTCENVEAGRVSTTPAGRNKWMRRKRREKQREGEEEVICFPSLLHTCREQTLMKQFLSPLGKRGKKLSMCLVVHFHSHYNLALIGKIPSYDAIQCTRSKIKEQTIWAFNSWY